MMATKRGHLVLLAAASLLLVAAAGTGWWVRWHGDRPAGSSWPKWAVVDGERLRRAHPDYGRWQLLQRQAELLQRQIFAWSGRRDLAIALSGQVDGLAALVDVSRRQQYQLLWQQRVAEQRNELGRQLRDRQTAWREEVEHKVSDFQRARQAEHQLELVNLRMKQAALTMSDQERALITRRYEEINRQIDREVADYRRQQEAILAEKLSADRRQMEEQLGEYAEQVGRQIAAGINGMPTDSLLAMQQGVEQSGRQLDRMRSQLAGLQAESAAVSRRIDDDIARAVARAAADKGVSLVWSGVRFNRDCDDLTGVVLTAMSGDFVDQ
ncbi:MAG: hypothetical protein N3A57_06000 [Negativicutes bacterium]|nr:hypothetical protein [Negativicutes bacterium]